MIHQGQNVYGIVKKFLVLRPVDQEAYAEECFADVRWGETIPYDHTKRLQKIYIRPQSASSYKEFCDRLSIYSRQTPK